MCLGLTAQIVRSNVNKTDWIMIESAAKEALGHHMMDVRIAYEQKDWRLLRMALGKARGEVVTVLRAEDELRRLTRPA
jgi:hypothetical protein